MEHITTLVGADTSKRSFLPIVAPIAWFFASSVISVFVTAAALATTLESINPPPPKSGYAVYASKPLVLGSATDVLEQIDARAERLDQFFNKHGCPLTGKGGVFVKYADENGLPYWLVAAIAFQESSCGKQTPELNGRESYNAWGWGVYGDQVKIFDGWDHGIEVVSQYMKERFFSEGITDPCTIMKTYTPPSNGSWCEGVKFFQNEIESYTTSV